MNGAAERLGLDTFCDCVCPRERHELRRVHFEFVLHLVNGAAERRGLDATCQASGPKERHELRRVHFEFVLRLVNGVAERRGLDATCQAVCPKERHELRRVHFEVRVASSEWRRGTIASRCVFPSRRSQETSRAASCSFRALVVPSEWRRGMFHTICVPRRYHYAVVSGPGGYSFQTRVLNRLAARRGQ